MKRSSPGWFAILANLLLCLGAQTTPGAEPDPNFHLYLLIGQSNMAGRGKVDEESKKAHLRVVMLTKEYGGWLTELIERLRKELNAPDVPFVASELTVFKPESAEGTKKFNGAVQGLTGKVKNYACVSAEGLDHKGDQLHYSTESARTLGKRFAEKMMELQRQK